MKLRNFLGSSLALAGAVWLLFPTRGQAWVVIGSGLGPDQRDFRIFNNFTDPSANDNVTPDPNFPGALGAVMAIWKACVEWGSTLHGNGDGDPSQPFDLGSGGANFDAAFAGVADGVGTTDDNIFSEISGASGAILAYTELPTNDGWRTRFYSTWVWADGPDINIGTGTIDLQGVATHEYGHALGLGHTTVPGATMNANLQANGVPMRSIEADDIGGVQAIYGVVSATKPVITGVTVNGTSVTITGQNFATSGNEIWFTFAGVSLATVRNPLIVLGGQSSTGGGTQLSVTAPAAAGPGDVLVKLPGTSFDTVSNAWPAPLPAAPPCTTPTNICVLSPNSFSPLGAGMGASGSNSILQNNMTLYCYNIPPGHLAIFYYGRSANGSYLFGNGTRCIDGPLYRLLPATTSDSFGTTSRALDLNNLPAGGSMIAGSTMNVSAYFRDPAAGGAFFNTADVLTWIWCP